MKQSVLITGASRGIGRACALAFAKKGYRILANYHTSKDAALSLLRELNELGAEGQLFPADVSDPRAVHAMIEEAGHIDVLVNNAGISLEMPFTDLTIEDWDRVQNVCLRSVFLCCHAVLPAMLARHSGSIVNVSSIWGLCGASCEVAYSAAKAGVIGLTKALAKEVGYNGVRVNAIAPGVIDTDMNAVYSQADLKALADQTPFGRMGTADEIAQAIVFLAEHPFLCGEILNVSGGFVI